MQYCCNLDARRRNLVVHTENPVTDHFVTGYRATLKKLELTLLVLRFFNATLEPVTVCFSYQIFRMDH